MTRIRRVSFTLLLFSTVNIIYSLLCGATGLVTVPDSLTFALLFTTPDGATCLDTCLLGIQPSETSLVKAEEMIRTHRLTHYSKPMRWRESFVRGNVETVVYESVTKDIKIVITGNAVDGYVDQIMLIVIDAAALEWANLGQAIAFMGNPPQLEIDKSLIRCSFFAVIPR